MIKNVAIDEQRMGIDNRTEVGMTADDPALYSMKRKNNNEVANIISK